MRRRTPAQVHQKGDTSKVSKNFRAHEFDCGCVSPECTATIINPVTIELAQALRDRIGAFTPTSAYRCPAHNQDVGGTQMSQHLAGNAIDVARPQGMTHEDFLEHVFEAMQIIGIDHYDSGGIGEYKSFIHMDVRLEKARW